MHFLCARSEPCEIKVVSNHTCSLHTCVCAGSRRERVGLSGLINGRNQFNSWGFPQAPHSGPGLCRTPLREDACGVITLISFSLQAKFVLSLKGHGNMRWIFGGFCRNWSFLDSPTWRVGESAFECLKENSASLGV
jgi:hypothetical protein